MMFSASQGKSEQINEDTSQEARALVKALPPGCTSAGTGYLWAPLGPDGSPPPPSADTETDRSTLRLSSTAHPPKLYDASSPWRAASSCPGSHGPARWPTASEIQRSRCACQSETPWHTHTHHNNHSFTLDPKFSSRLQTIINRINGLLS